MKKTALTVLFFLFLAISAKAELDPEYGVPKYIIRTKPKYISAEDAAFLFKNQGEQLVVTFVERKREYARLIGLPVFPKKAWDIRYERSYKFDGGWKTVHENEVNRELANGQYNVWIALAIWSLLILFVSDKSSDNGIFGLKDRKAYAKVALHGTIVAFIALLLFFRFLVLVGMQSFVNFDFISLAFLWGAIIVMAVYKNYKVPDEGKQKNRTSISV